MSVRVRVNGREIEVPEHATAAAAVALADVTAFRRGVVNRTPRAPLCGMGICFECRATIDGHPHVRSCMTHCTPGMEIETGG